MSIWLSFECFQRRHKVCIRLCVCVQQEEKDQQWKRAMDYLSAVSELNYMTQIVIMLYEDNNKVFFFPSDVLFVVDVQSHGSICDMLAL